MIAAKIEFLKNTLPALLHTLLPNQQGTWGVMNAQQMVEHYTNAVQLAYGKVHFPPLAAGEQMEKMYKFMMSDAPFRENTVNPYLPKEPPPPILSSMQESIAALTAELQNCFNYYEQNVGARVANPFFGNLNFEEQIHLLHKHAKHHLKQFGIV